MHDLIIVGGGPAGLSAALYACRSGRSALILEKSGFGGQVALSPRVENYPGAGSLPGTELADIMLNQAMEQGAEADIADVTGLRFEEGRWLVDSDDGITREARAVVLCTGAGHRPLDLPGEEELLGRGVSYCAVCDGNFFAGKDTAVAGGGDTALQEALLLSDICRRVYLIHRRREFRGEMRHLEKLRACSNVEILTPWRITALEAEEGRLRALRLTETESGEERELPVSAVFAAYGQSPATAPFKGLIPLSEGGYAEVGEDCRTAQPGLFVAGDCRRKELRQLVTAVSDGAQAAIAACHWLDEQ